MGRMGFRAAFLGTCAVVVGSAAGQLESAAECPGEVNGTWHFYNGKCYSISLYKHEFDDCNQHYCREASGGLNATLACVSDGALNTFLAYDLGGHFEETWVGLYQRRNRRADEGWNRQSAQGCSSTFTNFHSGEPNDWGGCDENCAIMGLELRAPRGDVLKFREEWVDINCARTARCVCEYPATLSYDYGPPQEVGTCAWEMVLEALFYLSLITLVSSLVLFRVVFRSNAPLEATERCENVNPMVGLLAGGDANDGAGYVLLRSGFSRAGPARESEDVVRLCRIVLQLIFGFAFIYIAAKVATWTVFLSYVPDLDASFVFMGLLFTIINSALALTAARCGVLGVRTRDAPCSCCQMFGYLRVLAMLNWWLCFFLSVDFCFTVLTVIILGYPFFHDLVLNFTFSVGFMIIYRHTGRLLVAIHRLDVAVSAEARGLTMLNPNAAKPPPPAAPRTGFGVNGALFTPPGSPGARQSPEPTFGGGGGRAYGDVEAPARNVVKQRRESDPEPSSPGPIDSGFVIPAADPHLAAQVAAHAAALERVGLLPSPPADPYAPRPEPEPPILYPAPPDMLPAEPVPESKPNAPDPEPAYEPDSDPELEPAADLAEVKTPLTEDTEFL